MSIRTLALQVNNYDQFELDRDALDPPTLKFLEFIFQHVTANYPPRSAMVTDLR